MTASWLALRYLASRPLLNALTALAVAAGVALVVGTSALSTAARRSAQETAGGYQLLVTAKGSPVQAVLSTLFFAEAPTGNIPFAVYEQLKADAGVAVAVPFSFGDSYRSHFIVATTPEYVQLLDKTPGRTPRFEAAGRWPAGPFEVAVGAAAATAADLKVGDRFKAVHGLVELPKDLARPHEEHAYTVVGVLQPLRGPADRAIFTTLETAWIVHGQAGNPAAIVGAARSTPPARQDGREITAVLVHGKSYGDLARLAATLSQRPDVQAVFPGRVATQVLGYLQRGQAVLTSMAWLATVIAALTVMTSLLAATIERRRQIAVLRALGASRRVVFGVLAVEAGVIAGIGALAGVALGRAIAAFIGWWVARESGLQLVPMPIGLSDLATALAAVALGLAAGAIPAYLACREDVARNLAPLT